MQQIERVGVVALLPLIILGALAIHRARRTVLEEVWLGNLDLAKRAATQIDTHVVHYTIMLTRLAKTLSPATGLNGIPYEEW